MKYINSQKIMNGKIRPSEIPTIIAWPMNGIMQIFLYIWKELEELYLTMISKIKIFIEILKKKQQVLTKIGPYSSGPSSVILN